MTGVWIDGRGREHKLVTATESVTVKDPHFGFDRLIVKGQNVPPELEAAYNEAVGDETADELHGLTRKQLDELAAERGVEEPEKLENKDAVKAAIRERSTESSQ